MRELTKNKYLISIIVVLSVCLITLFGIAVTLFLNDNNISNMQGNNEYNEEQNKDIQNTISNEEGKSEEENIIKVELEDNTNTDNTEQNKTPSTGEGNMKNQDNTSKYYIKINNQMNVVTIYEKDRNGEYTKPVKAMLCSIGEATPTSGVYKLTIRYTWRRLQGNVYGQYAVRITGNILFHSVPYTKESKDALEWWEYDKLGTFASLGCVRLTVENAKWIYENCEEGTPVEFYYDEDPGPLGKPTAKKISGYSEELRNWDPTDPDPENPWKTYEESVNETEN